MYVTVRWQMESRSHRSRDVSALYRMRHTWGIRVRPAVPATGGELACLGLRVTMTEL